MATATESFVDRCERVRGTGSLAEQTARLVQRLEWELHFAYCYRTASG